MKSRKIKSTELIPAQQTQTIPTVEVEPMDPEERQYVQLPPQPYYGLLTPHQRQQKEQEYLQRKSLEIQEKYHINPMTATHCELQNFYNTSVTAGINDYHAHRSATAMNKASRIYYDLCSYLYGCFIHFPNASKDWCLSLISPPLTAVGHGIAATWTYFAAGKISALNMANSNLCQLHMALQHLQQCRLLSVEQFMIVLAKINGLSFILREWRKLISRS